MLSNKNHNSNEDREKALNDVVNLVSELKNRRKQGASKTKEYNSKKLEQLKNDLKTTQKTVVHSLVSCQKIEKSILQLSLAEEGVKELLINGSKNHNHHYREAYLNENQLHKIEVIAKLPQNCGFNIQQSLLLYSDAALVQELDAFPANQVSIIDSILFSKIAWISSGKHIPPNEASVMFTYASTIASRYSDPSNPQSDYAYRRWNILKQILRKKLKVRHIANDLNNFILSIKKLNSKSKHHTATDNIARNGVNNSSDVSVLSIHSSKLNSSISSLTSNPIFSQSYNTLNKQLMKSKELHNSYHNAIHHDLSIISQTTPISSTSKSAFLYARKTAIKKIEFILYKKVKGYYKLAMDKLRDNKDLYQLENMSKNFIRLYSAIRFYDMIKLWIFNKMKRCFQSWCTNISIMKDEEYEAAIIEIQRFSRGFLGRHFVKNIGKHIAAIAIQRICRGYLGRKIAKEKVALRRLKRCVILIENAWSRAKWLRLLKRVCKQNHQIRKAKVIQRVYRGHCARVRCRNIRLKRDQLRGALKFQSIYRMFRAKVRVDTYYKNKRAVDATIVMQSFVRGHQGRVKAKYKKLRYQSCCCIQRGYRCHYARKVVNHIRRTKAAGKIQRVARGRQGRLKVKRLVSIRNAFRAELRRALEVINTIASGYITRKRWAMVLKNYTATRTTAANRIKELFKYVKIGNDTRRKVKRIRDAGTMISKNVIRYYRLKKEREEIEWMRNTAATILQRHVRGRIGRKRAQVIRERYLLIKGLPPLYFRIKNNYLKDQNAFHGKQAIIIECMIRKRFARKRTMIARRHHRAKKIQRMVRNYFERKEAKAIANSKKQQKYYLERCATRIQKIVRGIKGRSIANIHVSAKIVTWFLRELRATGIGRRAFIAFQVRRKNIARAHNAAIKIQAMIRAYITKQRVRKILPKLLKRRDKRVMLKKHKSATKIQSIIRQVAAKKIYNVKKNEFLEREMKRKKLEELEKNIDKIHDDHMNDLLAIRVQGGIREKLARKHVNQKAIDAQFELEKANQIKRINSAKKIQAVIRGVVSRKRFNENKTALKKAAAARSFCVECEIAVATKKCRMCKDRYCDSCYANMHRKGQRKNHTFEVIRNNKSNNPEADSYNNPHLWTEYYDHSAQAKYWYHSITGEATWICPY